MDLIIALLISWPLKTICWIFPLMIVIYCAYKQGYKKASILLLCMVISASYSWINQMDWMLFLKQGSVFFVAAIIIFFDLILKNNSQKKKNTQNVWKNDDGSAS